MELVPERVNRQRKSEQTSRVKSLNVTVLPKKSSSSQIFSARQTAHLTSSAFSIYLLDCPKLSRRDKATEEIHFSSLSHENVPLCSNASCKHTCWETDTLTLPWGCVYMQRPIHLTPNPQWVLRCHLLDPVDTRTGPEPLEGYRNTHIVDRRQSRIWTESWECVQNAREPL